MVTEGNIRDGRWCVSGSVTLSHRRARFDSSVATKADSGNGEGGQLFSLMTPNASALAPMIPAMEHRFFGTLTIAVVAGLTLLGVLYVLHSGLLLLLIAIYGD